MEPYKDIKTTITEALTFRNLTHAKLSQVTGVQEHYLLAIENLETSRLPAAPYVKGYLRKVAAALDLSYEELWKTYEKELEHKRSGAHDRLPENRFAIRPMDKRIIAGAIVGVLVIAYGILNIRNVSGIPSLTIIDPVEATMISAVSPITLRGAIDPKNKLLINDVETLTDAQGNFQTDYNLQSGRNTIEFKVKKLLGRERKEQRQIIFEPPIPPVTDTEPATSTENTPTNNESQP